VQILGRTTAETWVKRWRLAPQSSVTALFPQRVKNMDEVAL